MIFVVHVDKDSVAAFCTFKEGFGFTVCDALVGIPDGHAVFVIHSVNPYAHAAILQQPGTTIAPHPHGPSRQIGSKHARLFAHAGAHPEMDPHQLRIALARHPDHPHPLLDPEAG